MHLFVNVIIGFFSFCIFIKFFLYLSFKIYIIFAVFVFKFILFLAVLSLCCFACVFSSCGKQGLLLVAVLLLLIAVASLVEHRL